MLVSAATVTVTGSAPAATMVATDTYLSDTADENPAFADHHRGSVGLVERFFRAGPVAAMFTIAALAMTVANRQANRLVRSAPPVDSRRESDPPCDPGRPE